jgi:hypothetical protein
MSKLIDLVGQKYGRLTVVGKAESRGKSTYWNCICDCGNPLIVEVRGTHLKNGHVSSCGCYRKELRLNNLVGQIFGELTVVERAPNKGDDTYWKCRCSCGKYVEVCACHLTRGETISCGCIRKSLGERLVSEYLTFHNIDFETEVKFADCVDKKALPFDFYIPHHNTLIEVQGEQHYKPIDFAGRGVEWAKEQLKNTQRRDKIKHDYCKAKGINLIYIPYWEYDNIGEILKF